MKAAFSQRIVAVTWAAAAQVTSIVDGTEAINRIRIDAWQVARVHQAIARTGGTTVIIAGTDFAICAPLPALSTVAEGYATFVVVDASGRFNSVPSVATITRLAQAGGALVNARTIALEIMAENAHPTANEI